MAHFLPDSAPILAPNLYTPEALSSLIELPDLASATIKEYHIRFVLPGFTAMSRVALARDDTAAYQGWVDRAIRFTDDAEDREDIGPEWAQSNTAALHFFGAMHGNEDAADQLHHSVADPTSEALRTVLRLCAEHKVSPTSWINSYTFTPDERAEAWGWFLERKRTRLFNEGVQATASQLYEPGAEQFVHDVISGELSTLITLDTALEAYLLSSDPFEKRQLISRYGLSIGEYVSAPEDATFHDEDLAIMTFAAVVNSDPDIPTEVKVDLSNEVRPEVPPWSDDQGIDIRAAFELSEAIRDGEDVPALLQRIETMSRPLTKRPMSRDYFLRKASEFYARVGQYESAADTIAHIENVGAWCYATDLYAQAGGSLDLIHQADEMRQIFSEYSLPKYLHDPQKWSARERIATFFRHMSLPTPDYAQAGEALLRMGEGMSQDNLGANYTFFWLHLRRLLAASPDAVALGPDLMQRIDKAPLINRRGIYELFTAHGSAEMASRGWEHVQRSWDAATHYFDRYAHMALASAGVIPPERPH